MFLFEKFALTFAARCSAGYSVELRFQPVARFKYSYSISICI